MEMMVHVDVEGASHGDLKMIRVVEVDMVGEDIVVS